MIHRALSSLPTPFFVQYREDVHQKGCLFLLHAMPQPQPQNAMDPSPCQLPERGSRAE